MKTETAVSLKLSTQWSLKLLEEALESSNDIPFEIVCKLHEATIALSSVELALEFVKQEKSKISLPVLPNDDNTIPVFHTEKDW